MVTQLCSRDIVREKPIPLTPPSVMLLEATATAGPDPASHAAVARLLASFSQRLLPLVQLKKA
jgi:hypothetical protein